VSAFNDPQYDADGYLLAENGQRVLLFGMPISRPEADAIKLNLTFYRPCTGYKQPNLNEQTTQSAGGHYPEPLVVGIDPAFDLTKVACFKVADNGASIDPKNQVVVTLVDGVIRELDNRIMKDLMGRQTAPVTFHKPPIQQIPQKRQPLPTRWEYEWPRIVFLLLGRDYRGTVEGLTKGEARANLKRRFRLDNLPPKLRLTLAVEVSRGSVNMSS
jgi:hypothetical protein